MSQDKTAIDELIWLYSRHQAVFPELESLVGWLASSRHRGRKPGDYCPFYCHFCAEQRIIDADYQAGLGPETPVL